MLNQIISLVSGCVTDVYKRQVEKGFQGGGDALRERGYRLESLAIVESMDAATGEIVFRS